MSNFVTLLVEDDALQREALADVLKDEGFEVIECTTAEAAELIIASTGTELQALVTDHNLAGAMSGAALARYARSRHPHMNIVIMSGRTVGPMPVGTTFLQKPFSPARLLDAVRD
jgi:DNA-binding NtrC family response regulator